jgi:hypothetical protein
MVHRDTTHGQSPQGEIIMSNNRVSYQNSNSIGSLSRLVQSRIETPVVQNVTKGLKTRSRYNVDPSVLASNKQLKAIYSAAKDLVNISLQLRGLGLTHGEVTGVIGRIGQRSKATDTQKMDALQTFLDDHSIGYKDLNNGATTAPAAVKVETAPAKAKRTTANKGNSNGLAYGRYVKKAKKGSVVPLSYEVWNAASDNVKRGLDERKVVQKAAKASAKASAQEIKTEAALSSDQKLALMVEMMSKMLEVIK